MDDQSKKTALRAIPYGLYVLTAEDSDGTFAAGTVNWVTQASFQPPLLAVGVKADSTAHAIIEKTGAFVLNVLGKDQAKAAYAFFKPATKDGSTIAGEPFRMGVTGSPILESAPAYVECRVVEAVKKGDHSLFVAEVVEAGLKDPIEGRPDDVTLTLRDLGEKVFYGG